MEDSGFILLHRKLQDNFLWKERRVFSKAEAWIDILMEVRWKPEPEDVVIGTVILQCHRGESLKSMETWARRWGWSKAKVKRVLDLFVKCSMIDVENATVTTRIRVCNFEKYQDVRNAGETQMKRKRNASETQVKPEEQGNNETRKQRKTIESNLPEWLDLNLWNSYRQHRRALKSPMTDKAEELALRTLEGLMGQGHDPRAVIEQSIERSWKGLFPLKDYQGNGNGTARTECIREAVSILRCDGEDRCRLYCGKKGIQFEEVLRCIEKN